MPGTLYAHNKCKCLSSPPDHPNKKQEQGKKRILQNLAAETKKSFILAGILAIKNSIEIWNTFVNLHKKDPILICKGNN